MNLWDRLCWWWLTIKPLENLDACPVCGMTGAHDDGKWVKS